MTQRRMFSKKITDTDTFLDMPLSSQALYFHLNMHADDDGFLGNARTVMRMVGASQDDFKLLIAKQFIIVFEDGITVIKDWRVHNYIQKDRYQATIYSSQKSQLQVDGNKSYVLVKNAKSPKELTDKDEEGSDTDCIQNGHDSDTQVRLGKDRLGKDSKVRSPAKAEPNFPWESVIDYLNEKANKHYRHTEANKRLVMARHKEGFTADDMRHVIDNQCSEWLLDMNMNQYLRPSTLFRASKFEGYLNNRSPAQHKPKTREDWFG